MERSSIFSGEFEVEDALTDWVRQAPKLLSHLSRDRDIDFFEVAILAHINDFIFG